MVTEANWPARAGYAATGDVADMATLVTVTRVCLRGQAGQVGEDIIVAAEEDQRVHIPSDPPISGRDQRQRGADGEPKQ
jgi:hypothetical protein